jgi:LuxR family maltose regulon positive regulatory protein
LLPVEVFAITNIGIALPDPSEVIGKRKTTSNVLLTKLHISPPGDQTVHRPQLFEKLKASLRTKLLLVSAPAGFGKTTLISDWIIQENIAAAWYSLDKSDNDASEFISYMISAIQGLNPGFGENAMRLLHSPTKVSLESIVRLLINEIVSFASHFVLVLDDFHLISNREVLDLFTYFIEHLPANIHLVVLTRADPLLPVARLRSQHQLVELRSSDLSFSADQIQFLFNRKLKLKLSDAEIKSLAFKTEGWIAGLQLIGLSLQGRENTAAFIEDFKGDNRYIMDYLIEEVLKVQTEDIKEFLLHTSLLEQLSGPLCNAVLERTDSQQVLEMLENNNMFIVSLDAGRKWYRYHHLFADLLKQRLLLKEQSVINGIHIKAGEWLERNRMFPLAIQHLLQIQHYENAIRLLVDITENMWENGQHASIIAYGELLPDEIIRVNPRFSLFYAWTLTTAGKIEKAAQFLSAAEKITIQNISAAAENDREMLDQKKLLGKIAVAMAYRQSLLGNPQLILEHCETAFGYLSEDDPLWFSWAWYAVGTARLASEKLVESTEALRKALDFGKKSGNIYLITTIATTLAFNEGRLGLYKVSYQRSIDLLQFLRDNGYGSMTKTDWTFAVLFANMAAIQYFRAELDESFDNIRIAYNLCIKESDMTSKVLVLVIYAVVLHGRGDIAGAEAKIKEMEMVMQNGRVNPFRESMYIGIKANLFIIKNELHKARTFLESYGVAVGKPITYVEEYRYISLAILLMAENKIDEASDLLFKLYAMASAQQRIERMIEIKVFLSIVFWANGEKVKALQTLTESLEFAAPDEILMYHLNYLDKINPLLAEIFRTHATGETKLPHQFINKLKRTIEKRKTSPSVHFNLTTREREVLGLLASSLSNQQIADKLFISLNTVKTRLKSLYLKLDVDSRLKAVEKAKEMELL